MQGISIMKNPISSLFFNISVFLMVLMNVLDTNCSGNNDQERYSPIVNLPHADNNDDGKRLQNDEPVESSFQQIRKRYIFSRDSKWNQSDMEKKFLEKNAFYKWTELRRIYNDTIKANEICIIFSWKDTIPGYKRICDECYPLGFKNKPKRSVILKKYADRGPVRDRVMLSCTCFDKQGEKIQESTRHYFLVAKYSVTDYFLMEYNTKELPYINGYVQNIVF